MLPIPEAPGLRDAVSDLQQQLDNGLARMDELCERRLREGKHVAERQVRSMSMV